MMHSSCEEDYFCDETKTIIKKTFGQTGAFCAYFILPDEDTTVDDLINNGIIEGASKVAFARRYVELYLPKYKVYTKKAMDLTKPLNAMGVTKAMDLVNSTLFTAHIFGDSKIEQKVALEFNEQGAEGAAATFTTIDWLTGDQIQKPEVKFDRPFIFTINETSTGLCLFAGKINNLE